MKHVVKINCFDALKIMSKSFTKLSTWFEKLCKVTNRGKAFRSQIQGCVKNKEACPSFLDFFIEPLRNSGGVRGGAGAR